MPEFDFIAFVKAVVSCFILSTLSSVIAVILLSRWLYLVEKSSQFDICFSTANVCLLLRILDKRLLLMLSIVPSASLTICNFLVVSSISLFAAFTSLRIVSLISEAGVVVAAGNGATVAGSGSEDEAS